MSPVVVALLSTFKDPLTKLLSDVGDEISNFLNSGLGPYLDSVREKFLKTKTFLYRHENINFYDVYYPIGLKSTTNESILVEDLTDLFIESKCISIIGNAGSGKSMLMKDIFLKCIEQSFKIPIIVELRSLNDCDCDFFDFFIENVSRKNITPNVKILKRILEDGEFLILFDGYDELFSNKKKKITNDLIDFIDTFSNNSYILTSRPGANVESLPRFNNIRIKDLGIDEIKEFIHLQMSVCKDHVLEKKMIDVIIKPENEDYISYLSSPLLLSMFMMTFGAYPELPTSKSKFYWNVYDTLLSKHDSFTKHGGYQHEKKSNLEKEDIDLVIEWFALISLFRGKFSFDRQYLFETIDRIKIKQGLKCTVDDLIYDYSVAISILVIDGIEYRFPHRSFQEYFAVLLISKLDENEKEKIYQERFKEYSNKSFDRNDSFWSLCLEIDSYSFVEHFIIKNLKEFISKIDFANESSKCKTFLRQFSIRHTLAVEEKGFIVKEIRISRPLILNILEFLNILKASDLFIGQGIVMRSISSLEEYFTKNHVIPIETNVGYRIDFNQWDSDLYRLIVAIGLDKKISYFIDSISVAINDFEKDIQHGKKVKTELLDLI